MIGNLNAMPVLHVIYMKKTIEHFLSCEAYENGAQEINLKNILGNIIQTNNFILEKLHNKG